MRQYRKSVLSTGQLIQKLEDKGLLIDNVQATEEILSEVGYYRLRGYWFQLCNEKTGSFVSGITFAQIHNVYKFDTELRKILFDMTCKIEVALRSRFCESLLSCSNDPIAYLDPAYFEDKNLFWENTSLLSREINRSKDVFIIHNFSNHDGNIPIWAAVEVMSFGTLSKFISNLYQQSPVYKDMVHEYSFLSTKGQLTFPKREMFTSWIKSVVILRNICAHNSRVYNRSLQSKPALLVADKHPIQPKFYGLYQSLLAMKYLRPEDNVWLEFVSDFKNLILKYKQSIDISCLNLPHDWESHLTNI